MSSRHTAICLAGALAIGGVVASAQAPAPAAQAPAINVAGCVQKESSVLKRNPVAANVGMDDEFVITFARPLPTTGANETPTPDVAPEPTGTSGSPGNFGTVYRLTGDKEKDLKSLVGQRIELSGTIKEKEKITDAMSSIGTSGKNEPQPSNTAEIVIDSVKPVSGSCPPVIK